MHNSHMQTTATSAEQNASATSQPKTVFNLWSDLGPGGLSSLVGLRGLGKLDGWTKVACSLPGASAMVQGTWL